MTTNGKAFADFLFVILSGISVVLAIAAVTTRHVLRAATYLMGVLCLSAGFYILLDAELLAGIQILVYVGGIVVLLVIAVMLTQSLSLGHDEATPSRKMFAGLSVGTFFISVAYLLSKSSFNTESALAPANVSSGPGANSIKNIGLALLDPGAQGFLLPFELVSLLLLTVLVAGIVISRKETP